MSKSAWETRCKGLAEQIRAACAAALPDAELRIDDRTKDMLAEEENPTVVPFYPIGTIFQFDIRCRRTRYLFGWRRLPWRSWVTLVSFHVEEMRNAQSWVLKQGIKCYVTDERVAPAVVPLLERFARDHDMLFRAAWPQKDP